MNVKKKSKKSNSNSKYKTVNNKVRTLSRISKKRRNILSRNRKNRRGVFSFSPVVLLFGPGALREWL